MQVSFKKDSPIVKWTSDGQLIVFLDIDGPIHSMRSSLALMKCDPVAVNVVNSLLRKPGVRLVLSASMRGRCKSQEHAAEILNEKFGISGMTFHEQWRTGSVMTNDEGLLNGREKEIQQWLDLNGIEDNIQYYAIDDEPIDIDGVIHIKADLNGLPIEQIVFIQFLIDKATQVTFDTWTNFVRETKIQDAQCLIDQAKTQHQKGHAHE